MNWELLKTYTNWSSLATLPFEWAQLNNELVTIGPHAYYFINPLNQQFVVDAGSPYVTLLFWAQSDGAVRRAACREIGADDPSNDSFPPHEMLLRAGSQTYADILRDAKSGRFGRYSEHATYTSGGLFVHKTISLRSLQFHFRNVAIEAAEIPYAVQYQT